VKRFQVPSNEEADRNSSTVTLQCIYSK